MKNFGKIWEKVTRFELVQVRDVEMWPVYDHCFEFKKPKIVEIGSAHGASSYVLAEATAQLDGYLICIDNFAEDYYKQDLFGNHAYQEFKKNILMNFRDVTLIKMTSKEAIKYIGDEVHILFIDGCHDYEEVLIDCELYLKKLVSGGYVAFHDYNNPAFGVKKAVDEYCKDWLKTDNAWDLVVFKKP